MNDVIYQLTERNSAPRLTTPGPDKVTLEYMMQAALRAPDHAWLTPWRFIQLEGPSREKLGDVFADAMQRRDPDADEAALDRARAAPLRAPLVMVVVCRYTEHPKVPEHEQRLSAGCAAHSMLLAAEAQGYAGIWRTGANAEDPYVAESLGLDDNESIVAFLYFGSRDGVAKSLPERRVSDFLSQWPT